MEIPLYRIFSFLFICSACFVHAQQPGLYISGKIIAADDQLSVPGVSISIDKKGVGTSTNSAGMFALIIPAANLKDTLKVSCIGFKIKQFAVSNLKSGTELNITLEKNNTELKEVNIGYYDAMKIIQKAIDKIPENYINHPHVVHGFYRMYTYDDADPLELSEAVFDVYNHGYADKRADVFRLVKARNAKNERDFSSIELGQKPNSVFEYDVINHIYSSGFINEEGLQNHKFEVAGIVDIKGYKAYQIDFKEKSANEDEAFRGRMYIDTKTYAFIYVEFGLSPTSLKYLGAGIFAKHVLIRTGKSEIKLSNDRSKVSYQEVGNKWVLANVEGNDVLHVRDSALNLNYVAHVKFNYQVTAVDTSEKESFTSKMGRNENINEHESDDGDKFWKDYNILLSDYNTEDIFKKIRAINKDAKQKEK